MISGDNTDLLQCTEIAYDEKLGSPGPTGLRCIAMAMAIKLIAEVATPPNPTLPR
jgi:hypothetical protein